MAIAGCLTVYGEGVIMRVVKPYFIFMGIFQKLQDSERMAKMLRMYDELPPVVRAAYGEKEFEEEIRKISGQQKAYEIMKYPAGWPFEFPELQEHIAWAISEGSTEEDIEWWWNLPPFDRILIKVVDAGFKRAAFCQFRNDGIEMAEVMKKVRQAYAIYTEDYADTSTMTPKDIEYYSGEDRPLPIELHRRVDTYMARCAGSNDVNGARREKECFSSTNAWVRYLMNDGRL